MYETRDLICVMCKHHTQLHITHIRDIEETQYTHKRQETSRTEGIRTRSYIATTVIVAIL